MMRPEYLAPTAGGDQVVEVAGGLPQLAVAVADWGGGDPGQLLGQGGLCIAARRYQVQIKRRIRLEQDKQ